MDRLVTYSQKVSVTGNFKYIESFNKFYDAPLIVPVAELYSIKDAINSQGPCQLLQRQHVYLRKHQTLDVT